ncbi:MAG: lysylphosphatidylglycerol synthase transmembrane domain-containing protein, partial [Pseudomonadota bacterium]
MIQNLGQQSRRRIRSALPILVSVIIIGYIAFAFDGKAILQRFSNADFGWLLISFLSLIFVHIIASFRFLILLNIPLRITNFMHVNHANSLSLLAGTVFFNFFGQAVSRSHFIAKSKIHSDAVIIGIIEKFWSMLFLMIGAGLGSFLIFDYITIPERIILEWGITVGLCTLAASIAVFMLCRYGELTYDGTKSIDSLINAWPTILCSLAIQCLTLIAYLSIIAAFSLEVSWIRITCGILMVMLIASLPITVSGWGVRELSAGFIFALIGLTIEDGIAAGVAVGLLSILSLLANYIASHQLIKGLPSLIRLQQEKQASISTSASYLLGIALVFALVPIFVRVPTASGGISVSAADPLAILIGFSALLRLFTDNSHQRWWKIDGFALTLMLSASLLVGSALLGFWRFGITDWVLYNRLGGLFIIAAYLLSGLMLARWYHGSTRDLILAILAVTFLLEYGLDLFILLAGFSDFVHHPGHEFLTGWTGNRNKTAFILLVILSSILIWTKDSKPQKTRFAFGLVFLLSLFLAINGSRSGIATLVLIGIWFVVMHMRTLKYRWHILFAITAGAAVSLFAVAIVSPKVLLLEYWFNINNERFNSMVIAWELFLHYPVFGSGLGYFTQNYLETYGGPLVIH